METWVQGELRPDLTLVLDVPGAIGDQRVAQRGARDRFEQERAEFFDRVRRSYLDLAKRAPERYRVIDAGTPLAQVQQDIAKVLERVWGLWSTS